MPVGATNFIPPFWKPVFASNTVTLTKVRYQIQSGTSVTFAVTQNGTNVSGLGSLSASTSATTTNATVPPTVADLDAFAVVVSAVSGAPFNLSVTLYFTET